MIGGLNVLSWNACTLHRQRQAELVRFCNKSQIHICAIAEPRQAKVSSAFSDFLCFEQSELLWVFVRNDIRFKIVEKACLKKNYCRMLTLKVEDLILMFPYLPDGKNVKGIDAVTYWYTQLRQEYDKVLVMGDLNLHSSTTMSISKRKNSSGVKFDEFMEKHGDSIVIYSNLEQPTFMRRNRESSVLDVVFGSSKMWNEIREVKTLQIFDSDHNPILTRIGMQVELSEWYSYREQYFVRSCNLHGKTYGDEFKRTLDRILKLKPLLMYSSAKMMIAQMRDAIITALKQCRLLKPPRSQRRGQPWWNKEIEDLINEREQLKANGLQLTDEFDDVKRKVRNAIRRAKRHAWVQFVRKVDCEMSPTDIYRLYQIMTGKVAFLKYGDFDEEVSHIREEFIEFSANRLLRDRFVEEQYRRLKVNDFYCSDSENELMNYAITTREVVCALKRCKHHVSPGPDGIPYDVYKVFPDEGISLIARIFNCWFIQGESLDTCLQAIQVAIPKLNPGEHRGITMHDAIRKIFEHTLYGRLYPIVDPHLPDYQGGFRNNRSAADQGISLLNYLQDRQAEGKVSVVLFTDIRKAYDRVYREALILKLMNMGIRGRMLRAIDQLMNNTVCRALFHGHISEEYTVDNGIPQGGVLSCILWNVLFHDLPTHEDAKYFAFADDLAIVVSDKDASECYRKMTLVYNEIREWCRLNRVEFNDAKVKSMEIGQKKKRGRPSKKDLRLRALRTLGKRKRGREFDHVLFKRGDRDAMFAVEKTDEYRYLGIIVDKDLKLERWCIKIANEVKKRTKVISNLLKTMQCSRRNAEQLYQAYIRGFLNYGMSIWSNCSKKNLKRIIAADNAGLRCIVGILKRTSNEKLYKESTLCSLEQIIKNTNLRYVGRTMRNGVKPMVDMFKKSYRDIGRKTFVAKLWTLWRECQMRDIRTIRTEDEWIMLFNYIDFCAPRKKDKKQSRYHGDFWRERLFSRLRCGVLPTRQWVNSMASSVDPSCRHCGYREESIEHLFGGQCAKLDYSLLPDLFLRDVDRACRRLHDDMDLESLKLYENKIVRFVKQNKVFKKGYYNGRDEN